MAPATRSQETVRDSPFIPAGYIIEVWRNTRQDAVWLVHWHFERGIQSEYSCCDSFYSGDIVWELASASLVLNGKDRVIEIVSKPLRPPVARSLQFKPAEQYADH